MKNANLLLIFLLELATLAATGYWGFTLDRGWPVRILAGLGVPALLIALWALFGAPTAEYKTHGAVRVLFEAAWFGSGALALYAAQRVTLAVTFTVALVASKALAIIWRQ
ncbi:YrdB family protein [Longispora albida]|uniref:YrdB family protein n=1 Tax=Longispora albida TaxID=203523 RepID=UPI00035CB62C|nr:YrdB family protein [Longispora albida]